MKPITANVVFSIGDASKLLEVSPGVLRAWEKERLIAPGRTEGGNRIFTASDLERLRKIKKLYQIDKLNPAAIRRELGVAKTNSRSHAIDSLLGLRLREIRKAKGMTLVQVAQNSNLSPSFVSAVERGATGVGLETLFRLTEALGTTIPSIKGEKPADAATSHYVKAATRQSYKSEDGLIFLEDLIPKPAGMEAQIATMEPRASSEGQYSHRGQEFLMVLEGSLTFFLENETGRKLTEGDVMYLHSHLSHGWRNDGDTVARILWVNVALPQNMPEGDHSAVPTEPLIAK